MAVANFDEYGAYLDSLAKQGQDSETPVGQLKMTVPIPAPDRDPASGAAAAAGAQDGITAGSAPQDSSDVADFIRYKRLTGDDQSNLDEVRSEQAEKSKGLRLAQAFGDLGAGLAGQKVDPGFYNSQIEEGDKTVKGAESDVERNRKLVQDYMDNKNKQEIAKDNAETRRQVAQSSAEARKMVQQGLQEQKDSKRFTTLGDALDESKGRTGEFGRQVQFANNADRVLALKNQFPDGNLPPAQMGELASASAALIGGGAGAEHTISRFVPQTASGEFAGLSQWLTSNPKGAGQQEFAKLMFETAQREKALAQEKLEGVKYSRVAQFADLKQRDPETFSAILQSHNVDPEKYEAYKANGYKLPATGGFPRQLRNGTKTATVSNQKELDEAKTEGFK